MMGTDVSNTYVIPNNYLNRLLVPDEYYKIILRNGKFSGYFVRREYQSYLFVDNFGKRHNIVGDARKVMWCPLKWRRLYFTEDDLDNLIDLLAYFEFLTLPVSDYVASKLLHGWRPWKV